jgi:hypothetical protein
MQKPWPQIATMAGLIKLLYPGNRYLLHEIKDFDAPRLHDRVL